MPARWRLNPLVSVDWRVIDGSCVAFVAVSGETAEFDPLHAAAMACFDAGPASLADVTAALAQDLQQPADDALRALADEAVQQFLSRGWLERLDSPG